VLIPWSAALLHDVQDHKYSEGTVSQEACVRRFLAEHGYAEDKTELVVRIIAGVSFTGEMVRTELLSHWQSLTVLGGRRRERSVP
jgi:hypothetical protein